MSLHLTLTDRRPSLKVQSPGPRVDVTARNAVLQVQHHDCTLQLPVRHQALELRKGPALSVTLRRPLLVIGAQSIQGPPGPREVFIADVLPDNITVQAIGFQTGQFADQDIVIPFLNRVP